jgi:hypothetical protein
MPGCRSSKHGRIELNAQKTTQSRPQNVILIRFSGRAAAHGVTQMPTLQINKGFGVI